MWILSSLRIVEKGAHSTLDRDVRIMVCNVMDSATILLDLPQIAAATAQVLVQRFFFCVSINDFPLLVIRFLHTLS